MSRVDRETNSQKIKLQASIKNKRKQSKSVSSSALIKELSSCPRNSSLKKKKENLNHQLQNRSTKSRWFPDLSTHTSIASFIPRTVENGGKVLSLSWTQKEEVILQREGIFWSSMNYVRKDQSSLGPSAGTFPLTAFCLTFNNRWGATPQDAENVLMLLLCRYWFCVSVVAVFVCVLCFILLLLPLQGGWCATP